MKRTLRFHSQLFFRRSYKPARILRSKPPGRKLAYRPVRFGLKSGTTAI